MSRLVPVLGFLLFTVSALAQPSGYADLLLDAHIPEQVTAGEDFIASLAIRNLGPDTAENVVISTSAGRLEGAGCSGDSGQCTIATLASNADRSLSVRFDGGAPAGPLPLAIEVTSATSDPNPHNNRVAATIDVTGAPRLSVSIYGNIADPGATIEYQASIRNESFFAAKDVRFSFELREGWSFERSLSNDLHCGADGRNVTCTVAALPADSLRTYAFELRAPPSPAGEPFTSIPVKVTTAHGVLGSADTSLATHVFRHLAVTNTADDGNGSLRAAILTANGACMHPEPPCRIVFDIAGTATHQTIRPATPLPAIVTSVIIDGATQTARHGDTNPHGPEIEINGSLLSSGDGLDVQALHTNFQLRHVAVNGFPGNGVAIRTPGWGRLITGCYIGTDVTGRIAVPNGGRGVVIEVAGATGNAHVSLTGNVISGNARSGVFANSGYDINLSGNRIGASAGERPEPLGNGASGIYLGSGAQGVVIQKNVIAWNGDTGIATARPTGYVAIRGNSIAHNGGLGIDHGLDGVTPNPVDTLPAIPPFPVITAAHYDETTGITRIEGRVDLRWRPFIADVELFANTAPGIAGHGEGELFLGRVAIDADLRFTFEHRGDLRGRFLTATFTQPNNYYPEAPWLWTSEFSASVQVAGEAAAPLDPAATVPRGADLWMRFYSFAQLQAGAPNQMWTIVENLGPAASGPATVEITTDAGVLRSRDGRCTSVQGGAALRCEQAAAESVYFDIVPPLDAERVTVRGRIISSTPDPDLTNNEASISVRVNGKPSLDLDVDSPGPIEPGASATWTATVANRSAVEARDLDVRIPLPSGWTFLSSTGWNCGAAGEEIVCKSPRLAAHDSDSFSWTLRAPQGDDGVGQFTAIATIRSPQGDQVDVYTGVVYEVFRMLRVTTTADEGAGSLREAIERANDDCAPGRRNCKVVFAIDPARAVNGVFTMRPARPLPVITAHDITIDARPADERDRGANPLGPELELSGANVSGGSGLEIRSSGRCAIRGLAINGFPGNGVTIHTARSGFDHNARRVLTDNYIGTDPTGSVAVANGGRGVMVEGPPDFDRVNVDLIANIISGNARAGVAITSGWSVRITGNRIGVGAGGMHPALPNGASGIYLERTEGASIEGNEIAWNAHAGIATGRGSRWTGIRGNSIYANGSLAIDHGLDSVTQNDDPARPEQLPQFPVILSATWDEAAKVTRIEGRVVTSHRGGIVELFANGEVDDSGHGETHFRVGEVALPQTAGEQAFTFTTPIGMRGSFVTATLTPRSDPSTSWTSEVSRAVPVQ